MKRLLGAVSALLMFPLSATAGTQVITGNNGPTSIHTNNSTVINRGTISGGSQTGLKVQGSNNSVVNRGTITGTTGVSISGGSSSFTNSGTVRATSTGGSSSSAIGVSQGK